MRGLHLNVYASSDVYRQVAIFPLHIKKLGVFFCVALLAFLGTSRESEAQEIDRAENCLQVDGRPPAGLAKHFGLPLQSLVTLQSVYERIAAYAEMRPIFILCESPKFSATGGPWGARGKVKLTTELVNQIGLDADVLARIVGHEFAHISMRHVEKRNEEILEETEFIPLNVNTLLVRGNDESSASEIARLDSRDYLLRLSRESEADADEMGFIFSTGAGFSLDAAVRIAELLKRNGAPGIHRYFEDKHPGYLERYETAVFLEENQIFSRKARGYLSDKNASALGNVVDRWTKKYSDSGAAFLYKGIWLSVTNHPIQLVNAAFEDSVENFAFSKRGKIINSYQRENPVASSLLCESLIYEGKKIEALNCLQRLPEAEIDRVIKRAKWKTNLIVGTAALDVIPTLWSAQGADGVVHITNDDQHKDPDYMRPVQTWRAPRLPRAWENRTSDSSLPSIPNAPKRKFADLFDAARSGTDSDVYDKLVAGADINEQQLGLTALSIAVLAGNRETVEYLLKAGADKNKRDGFNRIPLDYAIKTGRADIAETLH